MLCLIWSVCTSRTVNIDHWSQLLSPSSYFCNYTCSFTIIWKYFTLGKLKCRQGGRILQKLDRSDFSFELNSYVKYTFSGSKVIYPLYCCNRVRKDWHSWRKIAADDVCRQCRVFWMDWIVWDMAAVWATLLSVVHNNASYSTYSVLCCQQMMTAYFSVCTQDIWLLLGEIFQFTLAWESAFVIHLICHNLLLCIRYIRRTHRCVCTLVL